MATNDTLKNQLQQNKSSVTTAKPNNLGLKGLLSSPAVQKKFHEVLGEKSQAFTSSVLSLVNNDSYLAQSEPMSIMTSAMVAATLDLPLDKNLGYAYIVPFKDYKDGNKQKGQFILGYKGYIQLAQRSGQYKALNVIPVYEGELLSWNRLTEEFEFDPNGATSDVVIGYVGHFELLNGFKKTVYWTKQQIERHRIKNNKARNKEQLTGVWASDYDAMATKTVLRNLLSKWGILSIEMQTAVSSDETVKSMDMESGELIDVTPVEEPPTLIEGDVEVVTTVPFDAETGEIVTNTEQK